MRAYHEKNLAIFCYFVISCILLSFLGLESIASQCQLPCALPWNGSTLYSDPFI